MKLSDLFKPRWQHSDWKVREKAVKVLKDQELLAQIALNDTDTSVVIAAVGNIENDQVLVDVIQKHRFYNQIGVLAMKRIQSSTVIEKILSQYCLSSDAYYYVPVINEGLKKITNQKLMGELALKTSNTNVAELLMNRISQEEILQSIALGGRSMEICDKAIQRIVNNEVLFRIIQTTINPNIAKMAAKRISDQKILTEIALHHKDHYIRNTALSRLTDTETIQEIARNDNSDEVVQTALDILCKKTGSQAADIIANIIKTKVNDRYLTTSLLSLLESHNLVPSKGILPVNELLSLYQEELKVTPKETKNYKSDDDWVYTLVPHTRYTQLTKAMDYLKRNG